MFLRRINIYVLVTYRTAKRPYASCFTRSLTIYFKMARKSLIARNDKRKKLAEQYAAKRAELKANGDYAALAKLPRNSSPTRIVNRCEVTGRRHGFVRDFGLSRIEFREQANDGNIPGIKKSSW